MRTAELDMADSVYPADKTDCSNICENNKRVDYDYKIGDKVLIRKNGILPSGKKNHGP